SQSTESLLRNGGFEQLQGDRLADWVAAPQGFSLDAKAGRNGTQGLCCENRTGVGWVGASQRIVLNRTNAAPVVVKGWSRAEEVSGGSDSDFSIYVDLLYADGTPLWGQTANFRTGSHDWEHREVRILPEKPVKSLTVNCLLRRHTGKAWFDDVSVEELAAPDGAFLYEGTPVVSAGAVTIGNGPKQIYTTSDGLELGMQNTSVASLRLSGRDLTGPGPSGFLARDVGADSDIYAFSGGTCT